MGESQMGAYGFPIWTMHMAGSIILSTLRGIFFKEWKGSSGRPKSLLTGALALLIPSTMIAGCGNYLGTAAAH